jgi:hypothetical protein
LRESALSRVGWGTTRHSSQHGRMYDTDVNGPRHRRPSNTPRSLARSVSHRKCHSSDCICGPSGHVPMDLRSKVSSPLLAQSPSNLRRARVLAYGPTRHPITFASITPPIAELRHTPSLQWQRYGRRYVPLLSSHRSSRGRFVGGAPWSNSLKRYCRVAIVNIPGGTRCPPLRACGK